MIRTIPRVRLHPMVATGGALVACLIIFYLANMTAHGSTMGVIIAGGIIVAPFALYAMWKAPVIFPYGLLAGLVPFDALLQVGGSGANVSRFVGYLVFAGFILGVARRRTALQVRANWYPWAAYVVLAIMSALWSINAEETLFWPSVMLQLLLLQTVTSLYPIQSYEIRTLPWLIAGTGSITAIIEIVLSKNVYGGRETLEINGNFLDPNHFSAYFMLPLSIAIAAFLLGKSWLMRLSGLGVALLISIGILRTGSRAGLIAVGIMLLYGAIRTRHFREILVFASGALVYSLINPTTWQRFSDPTQGEAGGRNNIWKIGLHAIPHYWAIGSGFGTYPLIYMQNYFTVFQKATLGLQEVPAHDLIIQTTTELGVLGLGIVLTAFYMTFRTTSFIASTHPLYWMRVASESMMLALFIMALSIDMLWWKYLWIAIGFATFVANAARPKFLIVPPRARRAVAPPADPPLQNGAAHPQPTLRPRVIR